MALQQAMGNPLCLLRIDKSSPCSHALLQEDVLPAFPWPISLSSLRGQAMPLWLLAVPSVMLLQVREPVPPHDAPAAREKP